MWPSAVDKKEPSTISWLSKPKEQREQEIEQELDDNYDNYLLEEKRSDDRLSKQKTKTDDFDERPIKPKSRVEDFDDRPIKPKPSATKDVEIFEATKKVGKTANPVNIDDIPIPTANSTQPKSFDDLLQEKLKL